MIASASDRGSNPTLAFYNTLRQIADGATVIRDEVYLTVKKTPIGPLVDRIIAFMNENEALIFWGAASFFAATHPPMFFAGFCLGMTAGSFVLNQSGDVQNIDFTALRQIIKSIIFVAGWWISSFGRCFIAGCTPGYHTYSLLSGHYYGNHMKGFAAIGQEINRMCYELALWFYVDVRQHRQLYAVKATLPASAHQADPT